MTIHTSPSFPFVERADELRRLDASLEAALTGQGQVCFVTGEAGSGKTALLTEFARLAQERHAVGNCNAQTGVDESFQPFREV